METLKGTSIKTMLLNAFSSTIDALALDVSGFDILTLAGGVGANPSRDHYGDPL